MRVGQISNKGNVRSNNEDKVYTSQKRDIMIIADGMGGHNAGEVASKIAIDKIKYFIKNKFDNYNKDSNDILNLLSDAINYANQSICVLSSKNEELKGMGTTVTAVIIQNNIAHIGHVGDSRAYLIRDDINQITTDHSLAEELFNSGALTKQEVLNHPHKNIITRALGCSADIQVDTYLVELNRGDILLLCTDGLTNMIDEEKIYQIIESTKSPYKCAKCLVDSANEAGGKDNISVIIAIKD